MAGSLESGLSTPVEMQPGHDAASSDTHSLAMDSAGEGVEVLPAAQSRASGVSSRAQSRR